MLSFSEQIDKLINGKKIKELQSEGVQFPDRLEALSANNIAK